MRFRRGRGRFRRHRVKRRGAFKSGRRGRAGRLRIGYRM